MGAAAGDPAAGDSAEIARLVDSADHDGSAEPEEPLRSHRLGHGPPGSSADREDASPTTAPRWRDGLAEDFLECTQRAEELVADCTGLRSNAAGPARGRVTDRAGWIDANLASFQRLLRPLTAKLGSSSDGVMAPVTRRVAGAEMGVMLGWMSTRVLGQYDLLVIEDEKPEEQDIVYYVAPNVVSLENRYAFDAGQFRLWLALHEVTHRAQFTGVDWMRAHFIGLVESVLDSVDPDPKRIAEAARRVLEARRRGEDPAGCGRRDGAVRLGGPRSETLEKLSGTDEPAGGPWGT